MANWFIVYSDTVETFRFRWMARLKEKVVTGHGVYHRDELAPELSSLYEQLVKREGASG